MTHLVCGLCKRKLEHVQTCLSTRVCLIHHPSDTLRLFWELNCRTMYTVSFLWPQDHRRQRSWVDDFTGQCLLRWLSSCKTFFVPILGLLTNLGVGQSWLFPASSVKFLTRRNLKSWCVCLAPHEDNCIHLLSTLWSRRWKNNFVVHLKVCRLIK